MYGTDLMNNLNELVKNKISLLIKQDDFDKDKTKVRLFCPFNAIYNDVSFYNYEFSEQRLSDEISFNLSIIKEKIKEKNKLNEIKKQRSQAIKPKPF